MPRLFLALPLPAAASAALAGIQPKPAPGLRLVEPDHLHLTLHHLGEVEPDRVERLADALDGAVGRAFALVLEGVGQFLLGDGGMALWAGVQESTELRELHGAIGRALAPHRFRRETRPFVPHITLAFGAPGVAAEVVSEFLEQHRDFSLPAFQVASFCLYSSSLVAGVPVYRRQRGFPLRPHSIAADSS